MNAGSRSLPSSTYLLSIGQALNLTAAVVSVTVAALVGGKLAPGPAWATFPYGVQFAVVMLLTYPAAMFMRRLGRRPVFQMAAGLLTASGVVGYVSISRESFAGMIAAHALLGGYIACANFYRFAAVDGLSSEQKSRGISLVVAGGVLAAVLGPLLSSLLKDVPGYAEFSLCYAAFGLLGFLTWGVLLFWKPALPILSPRETELHSVGRDRPIEANRFVILAVAAAALGYFIMNLLMVQASLVMGRICSFDAASFAIQGHVLAMFVPSFVTGSLIARFGVRAILTAGFFFLAAASAFGVAYLRYDAVLFGLLLLGLGWNLTYVGGGVLLAQRIPEAQRHTWQGLNDTVIAGCATLGAFLPAPLLAWVGWDGSNLLGCLISIAMAMISWAIFSTSSIRGEELSEVSNAVGK